MKQTILMEKYPIFTLEVAKSETAFSDIDALIAYFKEKIAADRNAAYIGEFDHYAHTASLEHGEIAPSIQAAKMVVFCFGQKLPKPEMMAVRPRSIGIADIGEAFVFSFLEAPIPAINATVESWITSIVNRK